jgi:hypothetical protein
LSTAASGRLRQSSSPARRRTARASFSTRTWLYDDHGARGGATRDPEDNRTGDDTFSAPNGTYTYPTDDKYADNAADLVELRVRPLPDATAFRLTYNTMLDPELVATTIALGDTVPAAPFPHGAGVRAPATFFLTSPRRLGGLQAGRDAHRRRPWRRR